MNTEEIKDMLNEEEIVDVNEEDLVECDECDCDDCECDCDDCECDHTEEENAEAANAMSKIISFELLNGLSYSFNSASANWEDMSSNINELTNYMFVLYQMANDVINTPCDDNDEFLTGIETQLFEFAKSFGDINIAFEKSTMNKRGNILCEIFNCMIIVNTHIKYVEQYNILKNVFAGKEKLAESFNEILNAMPSGTSSFQTIFEDACVIRREEIAKQIKEMEAKTEAEAENNNVSLEEEMSDKQLFELSQITEPNGTKRWSNDIKDINLADVIQPNSVQTLFVGKNIKKVVYIIATDINEAVKKADEFLPGIASAFGADDANVCN